MTYAVRPLEPWIGPYTAPRQESLFKATWSDTLILLERELAALGAPRWRSWVMQIDVDERWIRQDGELYARAQPKTPAVRVAFESRHGPLMYATDRFVRWQDNIRAIALSLEALRKVDRYGVAGHGEQYRGWTAIEGPKPDMTRLEAAALLCEHLGLGTPEQMLANEKAVNLAFLMGAKRLHPDVGGDPAEFAKLVRARDLLLNGARP